MQCLLYAYFRCFTYFYNYLTQITTFYKNVIHKIDFS